MIVGFLPELVDTFVKVIHDCVCIGVCVWFRVVCNNGIRLRLPH